MGTGRTSNAAADAARRDPDGELVARIARGDRAAATALVDRHLNRLVRFAWRTLGDREEAEDVAQDVFLRVWRHAESWTPGRAKFETWMYKVAMNLCIDRIRKKREARLEDGFEQADDAPGPGAALLGKQTGALVQRALGDLPERQRLAITLCHYQEMSNIEAAQVMEISVDALESLLARGRRAMRDKLGAVREHLAGETAHV